MGKEACPFETRWGCVWDGRGRVPARYRSSLAPSPTRPTPLADAPPITPALWPVLVAYGAAFLLALVASAAFVLVVAYPRSGGDPRVLADEATRFALSTPGVLGSAVVSAVVLVAVALVTARAGGPGVVASLRLGPTRARPLGLVAAVVGMAGLSVACGATAQLLHVGQGGVMDVVAHALATPTRSQLVLALLAVGVAPGVAEETFFRGLVQTRVRARWGTRPAIVTSAAAFGVFHLDPVQGALAFVAGLFLGWVVERFGGLRPSIAAHAINNAMFVLLAAYGASDDTPSTTASLITLALGLAACGAAVLVIRSRLALRAATA